MLNLNIPCFNLSIEISSPRFPMVIVSSCTPRMSCAEQRMLTLSHFRGFVRSSYGSIFCYFIALSVVFCTSGIVSILIVHAHTVFFN